MFKTKKIRLNIYNQINLFYVLNDINIKIEIYRSARNGKTESSFILVTRIWIMQCQTTTYNDLAECFGLNNKATLMRQRKTARTQYQVKFAAVI